ncbi:MAG: sortase [Candidatus Dormibacteria bacterium]
MEPGPPPARPLPGRGNRIGAALVLAALVVAAIAGGLVWHQRSATRGAGPVAAGSRPRPTAHGAGDNLGQGPAPSGGQQPLTLAAAPAGCGLNGDDDGELIFPSLARYGYSGLTGLGTWDLLHGRPMVHHQLSPAYGAAGNVVIGFHREPSYQHMDQLAVGDTILVHDRSCATFTYRVTMRAELTPEQAYSYVQPTSGHDLTMVTCTPWWLDYHRIIWRAQLVS